MEANMLTKKELSQIKIEYRKELLGDNIKKVRESMEKTQQDFATILGYEASQNIANIERGKVPLPANKIKLFCKVTDTTIDEFVNCLLEIERLTLLSAIHGSKQPTEKD